MNETNSQEPVKKPKGTDKITRQQKLDEQKSLQSFHNICSTIEHLHPGFITLNIRNIMKNVITVEGCSEVKETALTILKKYEQTGKELPLEWKFLTTLKSNRLQ